jgi:hypothetical protein
LQKPKIFPRKGTHSLPKTKNFSRKCTRSLNKKIWKVFVLHIRPFLVIKLSDFSLILLFSCNFISNWFLDPEEVGFSYNEMVPTTEPTENGKDGGENKPKVAEKPVRPTNNCTSIRPLTDCRRAGGAGVAVIFVSMHSVSHCVRVHGISLVEMSFWFGFDFVFPFYTVPPTIKL